MGFSRQEYWSGLPFLHSVQFSCSVVSDSLWPHESQHARLLCPSPTPRVHSDSRPSSQWCHPAISSSAVPFSSCPQSLPASDSFPMSQHFAWGGQSTGVSALASLLPKKSQGWSPSEWTNPKKSKEIPGLISFRMDKITADGDCSHEIKRRLLLGRKVMTNLDSILWRRQWHPTPVLLPRKSHGWRSLVGCSLWGR